MRKNIQLFTEIKRKNQISCIPYNPNKTNFFQICTFDYKSSLYNQPQEKFDSTDNFYPQYELYTKFL